MVLMERAGLAVYGAVKQVLPERGRIAVVCGKGNNGGDGFVLARLALQDGHDVECLVCSPESGLSPDSRQEMLQAKAQGVQPIFSDDGRWRHRLERLGQFDLVVDAILGIGAAGHVHGVVEEAILAINRSGVPVIAIDVPSGIHSDTGEELGSSVWALKTVTLGLPKPFLFQGIGLEHSGRWDVADIGFPRELVKEPTGAFLMDPQWVCSMIPERLRGSHKGNNGHVLIVAGCHRMRGAAVLAAKAALRTGAGLITVAAIESVCQAVIEHCPEATLIPLPEEGGCITAAAASQILDEQGRWSAAFFGPGLSHEPQVREFLSTVWAKWETPCVVDADALNAVSMGARLPETDCVLTPHPGEMSRLLKVTTAEVQADRFQTVRCAVDRFGKTVLLKGPYSIVGAQCEPLLVNPTGNPGMAAAGMGDALGGVIATLMAQDLPGYYAAGVGMYWHGLAGDICAAEIGPVGFAARDVCRAIPKARAKLNVLCSEA